LNTTVDYGTMGNQLYYAIKQFIVNHWSGQFLFFIYFSKSLLNPW